MVKKINDNNIRYSNPIGFGFMCNEKIEIFYRYLPSYLSYKQIEIVY